MRLTWTEIPTTQPLRMSNLLAFMERWRTGSTKDVRAASSEQIAALVKPLSKGRSSLPSVYLDFLETMGEHSGELRLMRGVTSASELLVDRADLNQHHVDPNRYFKYGIGEVDYNGRQPDDFLDLTRKTPDGADAKMMRIHEERLCEGKVAPEEPFASFSDLVRAVVVMNFCLLLDPNRRPLSVGFGADVEAVKRVYEFLAKLGFELTELGASANVIPLETPRQQAVALLRRSTTVAPLTLLMLRAPDKTEELRLSEIISDHRAALAGA
ncbi:MAG: hypothetical protein ACKVX7_14915 [Planctomycetota bacterium]